MNGTVDMAFGREVHYRPNCVVLEQDGDGGLVCYAVGHGIMGQVSFDRGQIVRVSWRGQLVEIDELLVGPFDPVQHDSGTDETCSARDQYRPFIDFASCLAAEAGAS